MTRHSLLAVVVAAGLLAAFGSEARAYWSPDGTAVCAASNDQDYAEPVTDGAGGAIVTWQDDRSGTQDIYVQRIDATGAAQWTTNGVAVCTASNYQFDPQLISDGSGGVIVTWPDFRSSSVYDVYAQRINASGVAQWTPNGVLVSTATWDQDFPVLVTDGAGGAIIAWQDTRSTTNFDIYAQRINASGLTQWAASDVAVCTASSDQFLPHLVSDGSGGVIITWEDGRSSSVYDIYAQRVNASGVAQWTANGVAVCTASNNQTEPQLVSDGAGGVIITWRDSRSGTSDIYAQQVNASGVAQWTANGAAVCTASNNQSRPELVSDGSGGAIITWRDVRVTDDQNIYAQRIDASGVVQWTADGLAICTVFGFQELPQLISDGLDGAIITWFDGRSYATSGLDIYAHLVDGEGRPGYVAPTIDAVRDVPGDQGGAIQLTWYGARQERLDLTGLTEYTVWRSISPIQVPRLIEGGATLLDDLSDRSLRGTGPTIRVETRDAMTYFWELVDIQGVYFLDSYATTVPTLFDSTDAGWNYHYFEIIAHTADPLVFWASDPDSGYSVDNLSPIIPGGLGGRHQAPATLVLFWQPNTEPDLSGYRAYRGVTEDFVPSAENLIGATIDTSLVVDPFLPGGGGYFKLSAVDAHGNASGFARLGPGDITGTGEFTPPATFALHQNAPNPFRPSTTIRFQLADRAQARLTIFTIDGRRVRTLVDQTLGKGSYEAVWNGLDADGNAAASGVYLYRLDAGALSETKRMMLIR